MERVFSELVVLILFIGILYSAENIAEDDYASRKGTWFAYSEESKPFYIFIVKVISLLIIIVIGSILFSDFLLLFFH